MEFILTCTSICVEGVCSKQKKTDRMTRLAQRILAAEFYIKESLSVYQNRKTASSLSNLNLSLLQHLVLF